MPDQKIARKRLVLEGVVIVASILVAFGIEAWWDGLQEEARVEQYVAALRDDALENRANLERAAASAEFSQRAAVELGERLNGPPAALEADTILALLVQTFGMRPWRSVTGGHDQVVAAGDLGLLSSDILGALADVAESLAKAADLSAQSLEDRHTSVNPFLFEDVSLRRAFLAAGFPAPLGESRFDPDIESLARSRRLDNLLTLRVIFLQDELVGYEELRVRLAFLLEVLQGRSDPDTTLLSEYVGTTYALNDDESFAVILDEGRFFLRNHHNGLEFTLYPESEDEFLYVGTFNPFRARFVRGDAGEFIEVVVIWEDGSEQVWERVP